MIDCNLSASEKTVTVEVRWNQELISEQNFALAWQ